MIYTHSLEPDIAVVWSGLCNLAGVLFSTGTVAFAVVTLLPVELILKVSSGAGFSMVFALLIAAILWNLGTWWLGLPASSSHTLVGSIMGVGLANQFLAPHAATSGVDWDQAIKVLKALLISPLLGFTLAALLILASKALLRVSRALSTAPKNEEPPPFPIRALMVLTCTGVSFFHGSNDGQKGMGLIMLILIGTVPTAYALNHAMGPADVQQFIAASEQTVQIFDRHLDSQLNSRNTLGSSASDEVTNYIRTEHLQPGTLLGMRTLVEEMGHRASLSAEFKTLPPQEQSKMRSDMYVAGEALRLMQKSNDPAFTKEERKTLGAYKGQIDHATKFIPAWVKVAVALASWPRHDGGLGRIVITVGEKIGKEHADLCPRGGCRNRGHGNHLRRRPVRASRQHYPHSQFRYRRNDDRQWQRRPLADRVAIAAGWVCTLPAAALLSASLYWLFSHLA